MNLMDSNVYSDYEIAGKMVEEHERKDQLVSVEITLTNQGPYSGLSDYDYQDLSNLTEGRIKDLHQIRMCNKVSIPNEIMDHFKNIKCHCRMGLFPEIGRAWLTIDSDIYIWTYEHARDVAYFDGLSQLIISVGLIKPKPNVFINDVKYLLVLTTPIEIIVLGVTFGDTTKTISSPSRAFVSSIYEEMQLMNKPIFVVNTDNISISCVEGTDDGRIFLGGRDGCLYEIVYQAESNWFGKRCKKVNHSQGMMSLVVPGFLKMFSENDGVAKIQVDSNRRLLYVLSEKGAIEVWDISDSSARRITRISQSDITNAASNIIKTVDSSIFLPLVDICVLPVGDYQTLFLIAVTKSGVRLYFGPGYSSNYQQTMDQDIMSQNRIQGLSLQHVRLPPGYTPNGMNCGKPQNVHSAFSSGGSVLMVSSPQPEQDILWSMSSDLFLHTELSPATEAFRRLLAESSITLPLDGQVWAIAEVMDKPSALACNLKDNRAAKKVVLLTTQGAIIAELLKPTDLLQQVLLACNGAHHDAVKTFFEVHMEAEACATSLMLACAESLIGTELYHWASQAFFRFGGEPHFFSPQQQQMMFQEQQMQQSHMQGPNDGPRIFMSTPYAQSRNGMNASSVQQSLMQQTQFAMNSTAFPSSQPMDMYNLKYSAKHGALYLHTARILRSIWNRKCVDSKFASTISIQDCNHTLRELFALRSFLEVNNVFGLRSAAGNVGSGYNSFASSNHSVVNGFSGNQLQMQQQKRDEALSEEKKSLDALVNFIKFVCEVVGLWKILCEHQLHVLISHLAPEPRQALENCTFREIILFRNELCAILILTIINSYLNDNASVKAISEKLREVCPSLYRNEDAISHKATEILKLSRSCTNEDERQENLYKALELCSQAAPKLPLANISQQFTSAGFYDGVIKLATTFAAKLDPNESALHFYKNNYPFDFNQLQSKTQEECVVFTTRMKCYEEVKNMLQLVYTNKNQSGDGLLPSQQLNHVLNVALGMQDQLLHVAVYEWMLQNNLFVEILQIGNPSLGDFLARSVNQAAINLDLADLLWKYYEKNGQHQAAAKILDKLASMPTDSIDLPKRVEYIARAVMSMRSDTIGYSVHHGEFLRDLEDKLDIAHIQKQILDTLNTNRPGPSESVQVRDAVNALNSRLFNMSQLYSDFAENFNLWESQLTILNCSHHSEPRLINSVWSHILEKEINGSGSANERVQRMLSKVQSLANEYGVGPCFPLGFIIEQMELHCFKLDVRQSPVPDALIVSMNFDVDHVLDSYVKIVTSNDRVWLQGTNELYLIESVQKLLQLIWQNSFAHAKNRRRTTAKAEDLISATLNALYTKQSSNRTKQLTEELRTIRQNFNSFN